MRILKNKDGFSELAASLTGLMVITCMLVISLTFIKVANQQVVLNEFANQMIDVICDSGEINSSEAQTRYTELSETLSIAPTMSVTGVEIDSTGHVQYGDKITVTMYSECEVNILCFEKTLEFTITKTGRSQVYWK